MMNIRVLGKNGRPDTVEVLIFRSGFITCWGGGWALIKAGLALGLLGRTGLRFAGQCARQED